MKTDISFAEIIESSIHTYTAQCWQWDLFPSFGSLVHVDDGERIVFGIVSNIQTGSIDPTRQPFTYQKTEAELRAEQPQIFEFLKTSFTVHIVGYQVKNTGAIAYLLPTTPCKIHAFVQTSSLQIKKRFFSQPDFLNLLFAFNASILNLDELLLTLTKDCLAQKIYDHKSIDEFCKIFTILIGNDYRRLKLFLNRIDYKSFTPPSL